LLTSDGFLNYRPWDDDDNWPAIYEWLQASGAVGQWEWPNLAPGEGKGSAPLPDDAAAARRVYRRRYAWRLYNRTPPPHFEYTNPHFERAYAAARLALADLPDDLPYEQAQWHYAMALMLTENPNILTGETARGHLIQAQELLEGAEDEDRRFLLALVHGQRGFLNRVVSNIQGAITKYNQALGPLTYHNTRRFRLQRATTLNNLSYALAIQGRHQEAEIKWQEGFRLLEELLAELEGDDGPNADEEVKTAVQLQIGRARSTGGQLTRFWVISGRVGGSGVRKMFDDAETQYTQAIQIFEAYHEIAWLMKVVQELAFSEYQRLDSELHGREPGAVERRNFVTTLGGEAIRGRLERAYLLCDATTRAEAVDHLAGVLRRIGDEYRKLDGESYHKFLAAYEYAAEVSAYGFSQARNIHDAFRMMDLGVGWLRALLVVKEEQAEQAINALPLTKASDGPSLYEIEQAKNLRWRIYNRYFDEVWKLYDNEISGPAEAVLKDVVKKDVVKEDQDDDLYYRVLTAVSEITLIVTQLKGAYAVYGTDPPVNTHAWIGKLVQHIYQLYHDLTTSSIPNIVLRLFGDADIDWLHGQAETHSENNEWLSLKHAIERWKLARKQHESRYSV
jgi:hypothetical protein